MTHETLRNVAIIAHVDHGKTTLVDEMLKQGGVFRDHQVVQERAMDSGDLERERGITILAKNTAAHYKGVKINIVDTPGHADFGGEVERILKMVDGVLLLVDAAEGPMPQTRFVLERALALGHKVIIVINKIDRPDARLSEVGDEVLELLLELDGDEASLDSPILYCSARQGVASTSPALEEEGNLLPLFDAVLQHIPAPRGDREAPAKVLVSAIDYNDYVGRIGIGRVESGRIRVNDPVVICSHVDESRRFQGKMVALFEFDGLRRSPVDVAEAGDIVAFAGVGDITIGDTVCDPADVAPLPFVKISEPTVEMTFSVNDSPFAGREGKFVTSRNLRDRLYRELLKDVSLRISESGSTDAFNVAGRGEMHLSILIETMRREGYEFQVSTPRVLYHEKDGVRHEPVERLIADVPETAVGAVMEKLGARKGELQHMAPLGDRMRLEFLIPARGLFGYRGEFLTDTRGEGVLNTVFYGYVPYKGEISRRAHGSLVAHETGETTAYGLFGAQDRGELFLGAGVPVYAGMVIGASPKVGDVVVNICRKKQLTNVRASGSDDALRLTPPRVMSLEQALEFLDDDELLEITPESIRIRKRQLDHGMRLREQKKASL
ncbi:translational GTPase TypA [Oscillospiraceae bacterium OttesenSCG-928-F05]|nr:translational GTPase TypA [Oscillospiraceae bacterium OttesenSCG-928-F05]